MGIKWVGIGLKAYFKDSFNTFDCVIVLLSIIDLTLFSLIDSGQGGALSAMRAFRLLRVFRLAKSWK